MQVTSKGSDQTTLLKSHAMAQIIYANGVHLSWIFLKPLLKVGMRGI